MLNARALIASIATLVGCEYKSATFVGPEVHGERAMLLIASAPDRPLEAWAIPLGQSTATYFPITGAGDAQLFAVMFECTLDALQLVAGRVELSSRGVTRSIPPASRVMLASVGDGVQREWIETSLPEEIATLRIDGAEIDLCDLEALDLELVDYVLPETVGANPRFAVSLGDGTAMIGTDAGAYFRVTDTGVFPLASLSTAPVLGAFLDSDGEVWLVELGGRVLKGHPDRGFAAVSSTPSKSGVQRVYVDGSASELFALSDDAVWERFDGSSWSLLDRGERLTDWWKGDLAWVGPGAAIVVEREPGRILRYEGGAVSEVRPELADDARPTTVEFIPRLGAVIGADNGVILVADLESSGTRPAGTWRDLAGSPFGGRVLAFAPLGDGFLALGSKGAGAQYHPRTGFCGYGNYAANDVRPIVPFGDRLLLTARARALNVNIVITVVQARPNQRCRG